MLLSISIQKMIRQDVLLKLTNLKEFSKFKKLKCEIYGISKDNLKSHHKFKDKYKIKFDLLADEEIKVLKKIQSLG